MSGFPFYRAIIDLTEREHDLIVDGANSGETISETIKRFALLLASPVMLSSQLIADPHTEFFPGFPPTELVPCKACNQTGVWDVPASRRYPTVSGEQRELCESCHGAGVVRV